MKKITNVISILIFVSLFNFMVFAQKEENKSKNTEKHFKSEETFPKGEQISNLIGSFFTGIKDYNVVRYTFGSEYGKVWSAVKRVGRKFDKEGGRPLIAIDEQNGRIQNGKISQDAMIGMGTLAWLDEFIIEVTKTENGTKVAVMRKVVQRELNGNRPWKTQWSNSKIEKWLLSQIEDEISNTSVNEEIYVDNPNDATDYAQTAPGKYVREDQSSDYLELKTDGSFFLMQTGKGYTGTYKITGKEILIMFSTGLADKGRLNTDVLIDSQGTVWQKKESYPISAKIPEQTKNGLSNVDSLTNSNILQLVEAKIPDNVIIAKIKKSKCKFNTSAEELVKLKKAGVSDVVIQEMVLASEN